MKASQILRNLGTFEERRAGSDGIDSVAAAIAQITSQAETAVAQALADGTPEQCARRAERREDVAWEAAHGEAAGFPWQILAESMQILAERLW